MKQGLGHFYKKTRLRVATKGTRPVGAKAFNIFIFCQKHTVVKILALDLLSYASKVLLK